MPDTVVIADDITGANDIGIMYAKAGLHVRVYSLSQEKEYTDCDCDVLIIDTDSRFDTDQAAYHKVSKALAGQQKSAARQYIDKQCSVFRGNIGAEFDAMLDSLKEEFAPVVLGFPDNGRTTWHSEHFVFGIPLSQSQFRSDPVHPMTESNLVTILQAQTKRKVGAISYEVYDKGESALSEAIKEAKQNMNYCIMDVRDNEDLKLLARVLKKERILCGSSALAAYLAPVCERKKGDAAVTLRQTDTRVLCIAGSLTPQTAAQIQYMKERGYAVYEMDTRKLFTDSKRAGEQSRLTALLREACREEKPVLLHSMNRQEEVAQTKKEAERLGFDNTQISLRVSETLADIAVTVIEEAQLRNIIVCGGDTSASLCARLGVKGMQVLEEIEAGLPTCRGLTPPYYTMVLKSGSFGSREFIEKACACMQGGYRMSVMEQLEMLVVRYPVLKECKDAIWEVYHIIKESYDQKGMLLVCGNGGSGADSEHIVGELMKEFAIKRPIPEEDARKLQKISAEHGKLLSENLQGALPAITLTGNISLSTAFANDAKPELVFAQQVYGYAKTENVLMGISTSGNSLNVVYALETAKAMGMKTIGLTGKNGGRMKNLCDVCICVPSEITPDIQELHLPVYHALCKMIEEAYFG